MPEAVIAAAVRSPIGRAFKGSLVSLRPDHFTAQMVRAALDRVPELDPVDIEDLMLGCGLPGGEQGFNLARVVAVLLGMDHLPGTTVTRYCSSSLQTTRMAFHAIKAGEGDVFISAGVETVSRFVHGSSDTAQRPEPRLRRCRWSAARSGPKVAPRCGKTPGRTASCPTSTSPWARRPRTWPNSRGVTREHAGRVRPCAASTGRSRHWPAASGSTTSRRSRSPTARPSAADDGPRPGTTLDRLAQLKPVFRPDGTVTAGNCCALNDGAAALIIMSDTKARQLGITPLARIVSTGITALSPEIMGLGPVEASQAGTGPGRHDHRPTSTWSRSTRRSRLRSSPRPRISASTSIRLNVNGGAIAVGHPFGMTGARITTTLVNSLAFHDKQIGLETMCVGGGQGMAMIIERLS